MRLKKYYKKQSTTNIRICFELFKFNIQKVNMYKVTSMKGHRYIKGT